MSNFRLPRLKFFTQLSLEVQYRWCDNHAHWKAECFGSIKLGEPDQSTGTHRNRTDKYGTIM